MLDDPNFSFNFRRSNPFPILSAFTKKTRKNSVYEKLQIIRLFCSRVSEDFSVQMWTDKANFISFSSPILPKGMTSGSKTLLRTINCARLSDLNFTNVAFFVADAVS